jgi:hypothetical protein
MAAVAIHPATSYQHYYFECVSEKVKTEEKTKKKKQVNDGSISVQIGQQDTAAIARQPLPVLPRQEAQR